MKHKDCGAQRGKNSLCGSSDGSLITATAELRSGTASRGASRKRVEFLILWFRTLKSVRYALMVRFTATAIASVIATIDIVATATAGAAATTTTTTDAV